MTRTCYLKLMGSLGKFLENISYPPCNINIEKRLDRQDGFLFFSQKIPDAACKIDGI